MADDFSSPDWTDLRTQNHWYSVRRELDHEIQSATHDTRDDYGISVKLNTATIVSDGDRSVLRVPVSAMWQHNLEQTIAYVIVTAPEDDEPRLTAIAHDVAELLDRWVEREVPVAAAPQLFYPEIETRWPEEAAPPPAGAPAVPEAAEAGAAPAS